MYVCMYVCMYVWTRVRCTACQSRASFAQSVITEDALQFTVEIDTEEKTLTLPILWLLYMQISALSSIVFLYMAHKQLPQKEV